MSRAILPAHSFAAVDALPVRPLTAEAFRTFGTVVDLASATRRITINDGTCVRHHDIARPFASAPGAVGLSLFDATEAPRPFALRLMERHGLGSQAFMPFGAPLRILIVVADGGLAPDQLRPDHLSAFVSDGRQGIQLNPNVWHHPLISLESGAWLIVDRVAEAQDCEVVRIDDWHLHCDLDHP